MEMRSFQVADQLISRNLRGLCRFQVIQELQRTLYERGRKLIFQSEASNMDRLADHWLSLKSNLTKL